MSVLEGRKIIPSENGFAFLENFTKQVYGQRGQYAYNLERYFQSEEWRSGCRSVTSVDQVPLLSEAQLRQQLRWEEFMLGKARRMQQFVARHPGQMREEEYCAIAAEMGLAPSPCPWIETLFPRVVDLWVRSEREAEELRRRAQEHRPLLACMGNFMMDALSDRQIISYAQPGTGRLRALLSQGYVRNFFRGENAFYGQSRPSLFRGLPDDPEQAVLHRLLGFLRMYEFSLWLETLDCVRSWPFGDVFHGAVAQHYGIATNGLDITSDFKVALFFACCTIDADTGAWRPLASEEFSRADARADVARLGGDSRYGMIFCAPADVSMMSRVLDDSRLHLTCPTPVGYQPFMRCARQSAYIIEAGQPYDLYLDQTFSKFKFRLTPQLCQWIYREMDRGRAIYPQEGLTDYPDILRDIKRLDQYSRPALEAAIRNYVPELSPQQAIAALERQGHRCRDAVRWCSPEQLSQINARCRRAQDVLNIRPGCSFQFSV